MTKFTSDPLLAIARLFLLFLMGIMIIGMAGVAIGLPVIGIFHQDVIAGLTAEGGPDNAIWALAGLLIMGGVMLYLLFLFLRHMKRIVDSVGEGDPFVPENAKRLTSMAWLMLAVQICVIPMAVLGFYMSAFSDPSESSHDASMDLNGIVLVVVLFILARVFRKGAEMREDLEGTV